MAALIRLAGETDAEFQRRVGALSTLLSSGLYRRSIQQLLDNDSAITRHLKVAELRKSCGVESNDTVFTWDVHNDVSGADR